MKRTLLILILLQLCIICNAQRIAVLDFNAGVGVSLADVEGISAIFNTYFSPKGYTRVERTQIDKAIDEQNFQRGKYTESQMVSIGRILNVSNVVVGDINIVAGQYNIDVRVINVQSGSIQAAEGATWASGTSYRNTMKTIAEKLAAKIAINQQQSSSPSNPVPQSKKINGHEYVDLGLSVKWATCNFGATTPEEYGACMSFSKALECCMYWGGSWRLPTKGELSELANFCGWTQTTKDGVKGYKVTGPNGNSIFVPMAGSCDGSSRYSTGKIGYFWSSTYYGHSTAYYLSFGKDGGNHMSTNERSCRFTVRLVSK